MLKEATALRLKAAVCCLEVWASHIKKVAMGAHWEVRWEVVGAGQKEGMQEQIQFPHHKSGNRWHLRMED